jgi:lysine 2,3-aminomutase
MIERVSNHIESLMLSEEAVRRQFEASAEEMDTQGLENYDPLLESSHEAVAGLIHKYSNRALCLMTAECAAYCRFCTRRRLVSDLELGRVTPCHIDRWAAYLKDHPEVNEVILSGGDPFTVSDELFDYALQTLSAIDTIKLLRIGTRVPVSDPSLVNCGKLESISSIEKPIYVGINFEHPAEITCPTRHSIKDLRKAGAILYSQSVFLKGVNDDYDTLYRLFNGLLEIGVRPYYIYHCDPVPGIAHFIVDIEKEREIMTRLRNTLSGLACPSYVIDTPEGSGKIPVPLNYWDADLTTFKDFNGDVYQMPKSEEQ